MSRPKGDATPTYHHGNLRNALIAAGTQLLDEPGAKDISLRALARMVGVSEAAPSRHFAGKEELLAAIAADGFRGLVEQRQRISSVGGKPEWALLEMMKSYVQYAQAHPGLFSLMTGVWRNGISGHPELLQASNESFNLFAGAVKSYARKSGWPDDRLNHIVHAAWAIEHGLATLLLARRAPRAAYEVDVDEMVTVSCATLMAGIAAGPPVVTTLANSQA